MNRILKKFFLGLYIILAFTSLVGCSNQNNTIEWNLYDQIDTNTVNIEGLKKTDDYPYGYNVGKIEDDIVGDAVLITPGTSININKYRINGKNISLIYQLHPQVADNSDGAVLNITVVSKKRTQQYSFEVEEKQVRTSIDLSSFEGEKVDICISVNNNVGANEICDWVIIKEFKFVQEIDTGKTIGDNGYVRSATYFSDEWPLNFWNSEWDNLEEDLRQIKNDGFDSVIIVIPWREFQPTTSPISYNEYAFKKLNDFMKEAEALELGVYTRIGYTWDFYEDSDDNIVDRFCQLMGDKNVKSAWNGYVQKLYNELSQYSCFCSGFLTWEDFWNNLGVCDVENENERIEKADFIGYQTWVRENYQLKEYNSKYNTKYDNYEDIAIPSRNEPAMYAMYEFYDSFLMNTLKESQKLFPGLSMEVRMDWDAVAQINGSMGYYKHDNTFGCADASYTATMYGIPMGFENHGEQVSAEQALEKTDYILGQLKEKNNNKSVYIEQFIFADNTPKFKDNAQIKEDELNEYLINVADILEQNSEGYGIWTYRNYCTNIIYNSQFALRDEGWEINDSIQMEYSKEFATNICRLDENGVLKQNVPKVRIHFPAEEYTVKFDVKKVMEPGEVKVSLGENTKGIQINESGVVEIKMPANENFNFKIEMLNGGIIIDNIKVYTQVQQGYLYDENNKELSCIGAIRELNKKLNEID